MGRVLTVVCRLNNEGFIEMMKQVQIALLAVDESHCISQVRPRCALPFIRAYGALSGGRAFGLSISRLPVSPKSWTYNVSSV